MQPRRAYWFHPLRSLYLSPACSCFYWLRLQIKAVVVQRYRENEILCFEDDKWVSAGDKALAEKGGNVNAKQSLDGDRWNGDVRIEYDLICRGFATGHATGNRGEGLSITNGDRSTFCSTRAPTGRPSPLATSPARKDAQGTSSISALATGYPAPYLSPWKR